MRLRTLSLDLVGDSAAAKCSHVFLLYHSQRDKQEAVHPVSPHISEETGIQHRKLTSRHKHIPQAPHVTRVEDASLLMKTEWFGFKMITGS